ncbi:efflux RND transporter permease subunit [Nitrosomonas communis]|uniref:efflux RND transporter permease subunit n=1 Tax=Nitrosomonas communis TaxID=44574 RepID=UPI003D2C2438
MHKLWSSMAINLGKRAALVGVIVFVVTAVLGAGLSKLEFATGQDSYLNTDSKIYRDNVEYQDLFGGQAMLTLFTMDEGKTVTDLFTPENLQAMEEIEADVLADDGVLSVVTPATALQFTQRMVTMTPDGEVTDDPTASVAGRALLGARDREPDEAAKALRLEDSVKTLERLNAVPVPERTLDNPEWVEFLLTDNRGDIRKALRPFFPDERHAQLVTRLTGNASIEDEGTASEVVTAAVEQHQFDNATEITTGAAVLLKDLNDYLRGGFLTLGGIAVALMLLILLLTFNVRWRLLSLGVVLVGVVWAFGLAGYLGIPLSVVTISGLPILLGMGIDFAVQMHSRVEEEVQLDRAPHPIQETTTRLGPALVVATLAGAVSFLALLLAQVPMLRSFGVLLAVGIVVVVVADIVLPTAILGAREYRSPTPRRDYTTDAVSRGIVTLGSLPRSAVPVLLVGSLAVFVGGAVVDPMLDLQTDPEEWVNQDSQVIEDLDVLREEVASSSELGIFVRTDEPFSDRSVEFVHDFATRSLSEHDLLLTASSIVTTVSFLIEMPGTTTLAPTGQDVANAYAIAPEGIKASTVADDGRAFNLIFRTGAGPLEDRAVVVNAIRASVSPPEGITATPSGLAVVGVGLLENLKANRTTLTYVALGAVFVFLLLRLRNAARALLCMVPVLMGVGATSLVAFAAGFKLSPLTALGGPLVIAACTEFTSLILLRYLEERERGMGSKAASDTAAARTGRAFATSALTTIAGVGVLAASPLPLLRDFGIITSINVAVALLSALVVLPPLVVWADDKGWIGKGLGGVGSDTATGDLVEQRWTVT